MPVITITIEWQSGQIDKKIKKDDKEIKEKLDFEDLSNLSRCADYDPMESLEIEGLESKS